MNADMKWLDNPEVFRVNQLEAHSDHTYYESYEALEKTESCTDPVFKWTEEPEFAISKNVKSRPENFYEEDFDAKNFDKIMVPGHIELAGYDRSATSIPCTHGREKNTAEAPTVWRAPETEPECSAKLSIIR